MHHLFVEVQWSVQQNFLRFLTKSDKSKDTQEDNIFDVLKNLQTLTNTVNTFFTLYFHHYNSSPMALAWATAENNTHFRSSLTATVWTDLRVRQLFDIASQRGAQFPLRVGGDLQPLSRRVQSLDLEPRHRDGGGVGWRSTGIIGGSDWFRFPGGSVRWTPTRFQSRLQILQEKNKCWNHWNFFCRAEWRRSISNMGIATAVLVDDRLESSVVAPDFAFLMAAASRELHSGSEVVCRFWKNK